MSSSRCGAWPKTKTDEDCLSLASSRKNSEGSAPGKSRSLWRIFVSNDQGQWRRFRRFAWRADVWAGDQDVGGDAEGNDSFGGLFGFVDTFFGQVALGVGRTFGVFAVDGDAVADDVKIHFLQLLDWQPVYQPLTNRRVGGNRGGRGILFRRGRRCGWRRASLRRRRRGLLPGGRRRRAGRRRGCW